MNWDKELEALARKAIEVFGVDVVAEREADVLSLDATLVELQAPLDQRLAVMPAWVRQQLEDLVGLLTENPERRRRNFSDSGCASP